MIPDFQVTLGGADRTELIRPLLSTISVIDKPGIDADTCDITLKAEQMLVIPERGSDVVVKLGYRDKGLSEVFSGVANRVGFSGPPDRLFIPSDRDRTFGRQTLAGNAHAVVERCDPG